VYVCSPVPLILYIADKLEENVRMSVLLSNIASIFSFTVFILNISCCVWFAFSCDNVIKGGRCKEQTWGKYLCMLCILIVFD